jgi:hypothetical protein
MESEAKVVVKSGDGIPDVVSSSPNILSEVLNAKRAVMHNRFAAVKPVLD